MSVDGHAPAGRGDAAMRRASRVDGGAGTSDAAVDEPVEPCLRCGVPLPLRQMGCRGGHCPNCAHPYPHGDCSD